MTMTMSDKTIDTILVVVCSVFAWGIGGTIALLFWWPLLLYSYRYWVPA
jgi:hypothetical protein